MTLYFKFAYRSFILHCALLLCVCAATHAQDGRSKKYNSDTATINRLLALGEQQTNPDSAISIYKVVLQMALAGNYQHYIPGSFLKVGEGYCNMGNYVAALEWMKQALPHCETIPEKANYYTHIAWVYDDMGDYVTSAENSYNALVCIKQSRQPTRNEVTICNNLGEVYSTLHQPEKAIYYYNMAEALARKSNYLYQIAATLINKGDYYTGQHKPDSAKKYYAEIMDIGNKLSVSYFKFVGNELMGKAWIESGDYEKAIYYLRLAINTPANIDKVEIIISSYFLGDALYRLHWYKEAEGVLTEAIKQAHATRSNADIAIGYTNLTAVYKATGQYQLALACMDSLAVAKDAQLSTEKAKAINLLDIKFRTAEKDKQIALQSGKIARKNVWILIIGGSVILLLLVSAGVYGNTLHKQRLNSEYLKSLGKESKIGTLRAVVLGGDNERSRIARELHDGIGGMLSAAMMRFSSMPRENEAIPAMLSYSEGMKILGEMGDEIRKTAHNLMPDVLLKQSLPDAVRAFCNTVHESSALQIDFQSYGVFDDLSQSYKLNVYRIVQELLKNVMQHAQADHVLVQLLLNESVLIVSVEDNGVGFNINEIKNGIGLHNAQTRVSSLDGQFTLESNQGKGTSVFIEFKKPLIY